MKKKILTLINIFIYFNGLILLAESVDEQNGQQLAIHIEKGEYEKTIDENSPSSMFVFQLRPKPGYSSSSLRYKMNRDFSSPFNHWFKVIINTKLA